MTLLYNIEGEVAIEMSSEAWSVIYRIICDSTSEYLGEMPDVQQEVGCFVNKIRSHLQHLEAEKPTPPPSNNLDLI